MSQLLHCFLLLFTINMPALALEQIDNIEKYHQNSKWQKETAIVLFDEFAKRQHFTGNETLIDVCSGDGKITAFMATYFSQGKVVGVDISNNMVKFAKAHYGDSQSKITFEKMDASHLHFSTRADVITSFTCMHVIENQLDTLKGLHQNLKNQGKLLMLFPIVHGFGHALDEVTSSDKWRPYFNQFQPNWYFVTAIEYEKLLKQAGFKIERLEVFTKDETYASREIFKDAISHWLPHVKVLPKALQSEFLNNLVTTYLENFPQDEKGKLHYYVDNMVIEAVRG